MAAASMAGAGNPVSMHVGAGNRISLRAYKAEAAKGPQEPDLLARDKRPVLASAVTGAYILLVGLLLMVAPLTIFGLLFDVSTLAVGWIRVFGILCAAFGTYYLGSALGDLYGKRHGFYVSTVAGRVFIAGALSVIVARQELPATLLILALVNLFGALSMWKALNQAGGV
mmetsp:Transcript_16504/g.42310  ORF Transcript_16504/g.42310 Transcript_16504/m.42310 type:complete len:170 (-) Transcript_16504:941-1450(-)